MNNQHESQNTRRTHSASGSGGCRGGGARRHQNTHTRTRGHSAQTGRKPAARKRGRRNQTSRRRPLKSPALTQRIVPRDNSLPPLPEITDNDTVRIIPVSGVEEIGRNMIIVETKDDIIVFDIGFQFVSEESETPGINYILPNTQYLEERKDKIRAVVITHGHLDHIGGIPFIMERIGNPPIYTQYLTSLMVLKRQEEFPHAEPLQMNVVKEGESFTVGSTRIKTFPTTHSIPDAMGVAVETPHGDVVITGDVKIDRDENGDITKEEAEVWEQVGKNNNLVLLCDSTNAENVGWSAPEGTVFYNLEEIIRTATGRLIIGTFASQFERLIAIIHACEKYGKKVVLEGRSIRTNIEIAQRAKLVTVKPDTIISAQNIEDYPSDRIVVLSTGAQGEEFAALMRMATDKHQYVTLNERDTVVLSSSVIPGNETAVQRLRDNIFRKNARVVNFRSSAVHSSGHGNAGELVWIHSKVKPKFLVPVHGHHSMLKSHMYAAIDNGFPRDNVVVPDNGSIIDIRNGTEVIHHPVKVPTELIMVDGFTVGERQEVVLRDRQTLAQDGMFVIIATVNPRNGKLRKSPDIISRGFVYLRESQQLLGEARTLIKNTIEKQTKSMHPIDLDYVKDELAEVVTSFLYQKTSKTPMVIPVLIGL